MKTIRTIAIIIATILLGAGTSHAQFQNPDAGGSFTLNLMGAMPMGDFAKASTPTLLSSITSPSVTLFGDNIGNAVMGAGLGFKAGYQFDFGLGIFVDVDAVWNQLNKDMRKRYDDVSKTKPNYANFPILLGLDYKCYFGNVFGLYAEGAAGVGLMYITPEGWSDDMTNFKLSTAFAWQAGGGILLGEHISLGVHYYMYGNHSIEIKDPTTMQSLLISPRKQNVGNLVFRLGLIF